MVIAIQRQSQDKSIRTLMKALVDVVSRSAFTYCKDSGSSHVFLNPSRSLEMGPW
jgi:hypothetical protein